MVSNRGIISSYSLFFYMSLHDGARFFSEMFLSLSMNLYSNSLSY
jgi:hypothetical protein